MSMTSGSWPILFSLSCSMLACGGPSTTPTAPAATASASTPPAGAGSAAATATPSAEPGATAAPEVSSLGTPFAEHLDEAKAAQELGGDYVKLLALTKLSPKTYKSLLKNFLWKATAECTSIPLVEVKPAPGLLVAQGKTVKLRDKARENLKAAAAVAKQRGMALEVVAGHTTIKEAVKEWNHSMIEKAHQLAKAAPLSEQKEKSFAAEARKALGEEGPKAWGKDACDAGRLGGWSVFVQLVALDASGNRSTVLVKAGDEGEHFTKDDFEAVYWDKPNGKNFRTLTEIMSVGRFVRQCSQPYVFMTSSSQDGTWRCKQDTESWDPPNRPIPAWQ